jgi:hypothetical protein
MTRQTSRGTGFQPVGRPESTLQAGKKAVPLLETNRQRQQKQQHKREEKKQKKNSKF